MRLEELLTMIAHEFSNVFVENDFQLTYQYERPYPTHFRIGYSSGKLNIKLLFVYEWRTSLYIGTPDNSFEDEAGWFYFERLVDFMLKRPMRWDEGYTNKTYAEFLKEDLANIGKELEQYSDQVFPLFRDKATIEKWESSFRNYVDEEMLRKYPQLKNR